MAEPSSDGEPVTPPPTTVGVVVINQGKNGEQVTPPPPTVGGIVAEQEEGSAGECMYRTLVDI
jgi:hypothetical protein